MVASTLEEEQKNFERPGGRFSLQQPLGEDEP
jgi:hypothetical protein